MKIFSQFQPNIAIFPKLNDPSPWKQRVNKLPVEMVADKTIPRKFSQYIVSKCKITRPITLEILVTGFLNVILREIP